MRRLAAERSGPALATAVLMLAARCAAQCRCLSEQCEAQQRRAARGTPHQKEPPFKGGAAVPLLEVPHQKEPPLQGGAAVPLLEVPVRLAGRDLPPVRFFDKAAIEDTSLRFCAQHGFGQEVADRIIAEARA